MFRSIFVAWLAVAGSAACVGAGLAADARADHWRALLAREVPPGSDKAHARAVLEQNGLEPRQGTYTVAHDDGTTSSPCRLPRSALMAYEVSASRGLYLSYDVEVIVCFDEADRVEAHRVGVRNAGV